MNILFITLSDFNSFDDRSLYSDLLKECIKHGHRVCAISSIEKRQGKDTHLISFGDSCILKLKTGNIKKTNMIEKGISTLRVESLFIAGIKNYFADVKFDLILYATPPVNFAKVIRFVKKRDGAKSYLMLKDIFPQNSIDIGLLSRSGVKGLIYRYFRAKEKSLYALSDKIGCMSQANIDYLLQHNPDISPEKIELCPNALEPVDRRISKCEKLVLREKYGLPKDKKLFIYGGNLGKPQDVPFIIKCMRACADMTDVCFVIIGSGTDKRFLDDYITSENPSHVKLLAYLPREEYNRMVACFDVGLIFLDHRFTIPNFPSRLLSYMQAGLPVFACTDQNTDVGKVITDGGFGWWCESTDENRFADMIRQIMTEDLTIGDNGYRYQKEHFTAEQCYHIVTRDIEYKRSFL